MSRNNEQQPTQGKTPSPAGTKPAAADRATGPQADPALQPDSAASMDEIDEASDESFPASDPPSYTGGSATPSQHEDAADERGG